MKPYCRTPPLVPLLVAASVSAAAVAGIAWRRAQHADDLVPTVSASAPGAVGRAAVDAAAWTRLQARLQEDLAREAFPGAVLAVGVRGRLHGLSAAGRQEWDASSAPTHPDSTLYDLASLTKAVATTTAVMLLVDVGLIGLDDPVQRYLPDFQGQFKEQVTFRHLLTHTSGLPPGTRLNGDTPAEVLWRLQRTRIPVPPGTQVVYSDLGFVVLWAAAEQAAGEPLEALLRRRVWEPLGMSRTRFRPGEGCAACAPTLHLERPPREPFRGRPHDEMARALGGIAGHAGLFSTVRDLARFAAMIASGGELDGVRVLSEGSVREMLRQQPGAGHRALGWRAYCADEEVQRGEPCAVPAAFGHAGYTGTSLYVDPGSGRWMVLLSNRTYLPRTPSRMGDLRTALWRDLVG